MKNFMGRGLCPLPIKFFIFRPYPQPTPSTPPKIGTPHFLKQSYAPCTFYPDAVHLGEVLFRSSEEAIIPLLHAGYASCFQPLAMETVFVDLRSFVDHRVMRCYNRGFLGSLFLWTGKGSRPKRALRISCSSCFRSCASCHQILNSLKLCQYATDLNLTLHDICYLISLQVTFSDFQAVLINE